MARLNRDLWDRSKDGDRREQRSFLRYFIVATALFLVFMLLKKDSLVTWISAGFTLRKQKQQIEMLRTDNARLEKEIQNLSTNKDSLEKYARENLGFAEPGEDVYIIGK